MTMNAITEQEAQEGVENSKRKFQFNQFIFGIFSFDVKGKSSLIPLTLSHSKNVVEQPHREEAIETTN